MSLLFSITTWLVFAALASLWVAALVAFTKNRNFVTMAFFMAISLLSIGVVLRSLAYGWFLENREMTTEGPIGVLLTPNMTLMDISMFCFALGLLGTMVASIACVVKSSRPTTEIKK